MQFIVIDLSCENAIAEGDPEGSLNIIVLWVGTGRSYFLTLRDRRNFGTMNSDIL